MRIYNSRGVTKALRNSLDKVSNWCMENMQIRNAWIERSGFDIPRTPSYRNPVLPRKAERLAGERPSLPIARWWAQGLML